MRILLSTCPLGRPEQPVFPLGLAYMASALNNHEVVCFDANVAEDPFRGLSEIVARSKPEVVGLSLRNIDTAQSCDVFSYWPSFVKTVKHLRKCCPDAVLAVGGSGFSLFAKEIMKQLPDLDFGIYLEGEESFPELLDCLDHVENVKGVYYRRNGQVLFSGARRLLDFDSISIPRRDILDLFAYEGLTAVGVQTKRGCAFDCMYCTYPFLSGRTLRLRSPEKVGEEVEILCREYGKNEIFFADNVFNRPLSHAEDICQELLRRKLDVQWSAYFSEKGMTADFIELALEAGCVEFTFSPDGSNDAALRKLGKGVKREQLEATYCLLEGLPRARFYCSFIWNYPQTRWKDLRDLFGLVFQLMRMKNVTGIGVSTMRILPNTRLHEVAIMERRIDPEDHLLDPIFYDPFPWNLISVLMSNLRACLKSISPGRWLSVVRPRRRIIT
jgi:anaerobic magnesium-protoporphyrin IX monomethyl ester cyclase